MITTSTNQHSGLLHLAMTNRRDLVYRRLLIPWLGESDAGAEFNRLSDRCFHTLPTRYADSLGLSKIHAESSDRVIIIRQIDDVATSKDYRIVQRVGLLNVLKQRIVSEWTRNLKHSDNDPYEVELTSLSLLVNSRQPSIEISHGDRDLIVGV
uniref:Uncharacterized protein n=1 Tax=Hyaloperonospora arabidopsidis (strain Emoy2) TaxID=559515 RepID=M4BQX1_HYAAE